MDKETCRLEEASDWLVRLQEGNSCEDEIVRWVEWCEADPDNRRAFERLLPLWQAAERMSYEPLERVARAAVQPLPQSSNHATPQAQVATLHDKAHLRTPLSSMSTRRFMNLAAVLLLMLGLGSAWWINQPTRLQPSDNLRSMVARNQAATLPDGSGLELGAGSSVAIDFQKAHRRIELDAGQAFFTVKHDAIRPFVVYAGALRVRAVGTAFDVLRTGDRVSVTVQEGVVEVTAGSPLDDDTMQIMRAPAGYQVVYDATHASKPKMRMVDPKMATAWKQGRLEYIEEPLTSVIANLNRYSRVRIVLRGAATDSLSYTGTIEVSSIEEWLNALPRIFPVSVTTDLDGQTVIQVGAQASRPPPPAA